MTPSRLPVFDIYTIGRKYDYSLLATDEDFYHQTKSSMNSKKVRNKLNIANHDFDNSGSKGIAPEHKSYHVVRSFNTNKITTPNLIIATPDRTDSVPGAIQPNSPCPFITLHISYTTVSCMKHNNPIAAAATFSLQIVTFGLENIFISHVHIPLQPSAASFRGGSGHFWNAVCQICGGAWDWAGGLATDQSGGRVCALGFRQVASGPIFRMGGSGSRYPRYVDNGIDLVVVGFSCSLHLRVFAWILQYLLSLSRCVSVRYLDCEWNGEVATL